MTDRLLESLGVYGASFVIAFIAGMFPLFSIEVFLVTISAVAHLSVEMLLLCCLIAAVGHQIAKTICYFTGVGALEHGKLKTKLDKYRDRIDRWNKAPHLIMVLGATVGIPPLWILAFIARPLMRMRFIPFSAIVFVGRVGRFVVLAAIPQLV